MEELSLLEKDTIAEVGNISLGASATALSTILDKSVDITTPRLSVLESSEITQKHPIPCLLVEVEYISGLEGSNILLIKEQDAVIIAALMMGESPEGKEGPLNEIELSAVQEAMNQMMGSMATSMSELFQRTIEISTPRIEQINLADEQPEAAPLNDAEKVVHVQFTMKVEDIIDSVMVQVIPLEFAKKMAAQLLTGEPETAPVSEDADAGPGAVSDLDSNEAHEEALDDDVETVVINTGEKSSSPDPLSDLEKDTIGEVGNISLGASATALSTILNKAVDITTPSLDVRKVREIKEDHPLPCLMVEVEYSSGLEGSNVLIIKEQDALIIAALMMGESPEGKEGPLSEIELSAVQEAMNQMMGSMATSMSELFQRSVEITPPKVEQIDLSSERSQIYGLGLDDEVVHVEFSIQVEDKIDSVMIQVIPISFAKQMANDLLYGHVEPAPEPEPDQVAGTGDQPPEIEYVEDREEEVVQTDERKQESASQPSAAPEDRGPDIDMQKLELVKDIPMDIEVVLGTTRVPLGKLFSLDKGGIVELDCNVHDPVELMANNKLLAKGEVVMINDQLGIRITEIQFEDVIESYDL